jgi:hypothetical protein
MKPSSAKAKGRVLQQWVRDLIIKSLVGLTLDDVRSTSSGANGEDVLLSPLARSRFPFSVECKNLASIAVYTWYAQAKDNAGTYEPLLVIKANRKKPLAVVDAEYFFNMVAMLDDSKQSLTKRNRNGTKVINT